ncbi:MAG: hypothetical protein GY835_05235 [bacterium]|nr:hypothetical protein [bacterium]
MMNANNIEHVNQPDLCVSWWKFKNDSAEFPPTENNIEPLEPDPPEISQRNFRTLLDAAICFLRWITARYTLGQDAGFTINDFRHHRALFKIESFEECTTDSPKERTTLGCRTWCEHPLPEDDWDCQLVAEFKWKGSKVPQILYEITRSLSKWRRTRDDITYWYYSDVQATFGLDLNPQFQGYLRTFVSALEKPEGPNSARNTEENRNLANQSIGPAALRSAILNCYLSPDSEPEEETKESSFTPNNFWLMRQPSEAPEPKDFVPWNIFSGLLEVTHNLGMIRWKTETSTGPSQDAPASLEVVEPPAATVLLAKIFGLKSSIPGFDPLFGGGLIPNPSIAIHHPTTEPIRSETEKIGILGVIRGRFGSGKSTLVTQLAIDMASKGGAGVLLVLEQSVQEALGQAHHYGWLPREETIELVTDQDDMPPARFQHLTESMEKAERENKGVLFIHKLEDSSLSRFHQWLADITETQAFQKFPLRFIVVDPLDAVLISPKDIGGHSQLLRNRTQQIIESATFAGFSLWLCTSHTEAEDKDNHYRFLPNIGDVVIRVAMLAAGERLEEKQIITRPLRLLEVEKVRIQLFAEGVHPFEILSRGGIHIYPSGESVSRFVTWVDNSPDSFPTQAGSEQRPISFGHKALDLALGTKGVRPQSVTTLMGPTGCAKTELALLFLLQTEDLPQTNGFQRRTGRSLFICFRDNWDSLGEILDGPVGAQLHIHNREEAEKTLDLLLLDVGHRSSGWILQQIQNQFKILPHGTRYDRVVMDNLAYLDLTTPLVRNDELFVPNLLAIFAREKVTLFFITSLVEGVKAESKLQTQIRDASHNLIVMKRNRYFSHNFIALQIFKSQQLRHQPQVFELCLDFIDHFLPHEDEVESEICLFLAGFDAATISEINPSGDPNHKVALHLAAIGDTFLLTLWDRISSELRILREIRDCLRKYETKNGPSNTAQDPEDPRILAIRKGRYLPRAKLAHYLHHAYISLCLHNGLEPWVNPRNWEEATDSPEKEILEWRRRYASLMEWLELQRGISIRLHNLDDYDQPMGEGKIELSGIARASARQTRRWE